MEELIGQRFSLISKSEIRYVGILHEINPQDSTIALEEVFSLGTEGRKVENFIPPSNQRFEYIRFKGSDVKEINAIRDEDTAQRPSPQEVPQDPAIVNSSRPTPAQRPPQGPPQDRNQSPFQPPPPGYPPHPQQFQGYYPPPQFGRGFGPPPPGGFGPGPGFPPYGPPPPGYYGPPGHGFPQGPNRFQPPPPIGPPGQQRNPQHDQPSPQQAQSTAHQPQQTSELPVDNRSTSKQPSESTTPAPPASTSTPSAATRAETAPTSTASTAPKQAPTQPKSNRVAPAVPFTVNQKSFIPPVDPGAASTANGAKTESKQAASKESLDEATARAKAAVAQALAKLPQAPMQPKPAPTAASMDALTQQVKDMGGMSNGTQRGRVGGRGMRGGYRQTSGGQQTKKIEIPKSDYDFESANAKFNKEDLVKEAIASGSPVAENPEQDVNGGAELQPEDVKRKDSTSGAGKGYNKTSSFFDNISSEARDREEGYDGRTYARQQRGEESKRNVETFGQANIDGGFRGRGRGYGRGRPYGGTSRGFSRGYGGGYRGRGRGGQMQAQDQPPPTQVAQTQS